jgi:hypothetical protein
MIYEQAAIVYQDLIKLDRHANKPQKPNQRGAFDCFNLLLTCSQVRSEFKSLYYQHARYAISKDDVQKFCTEFSDYEIYLSTITILITAPNAIPGQRTSTLTAGRKFANDFLPILEMYFKYFPKCAIDVGIWNAQTRTISLHNPTQRVLNLLLQGNDEWKNAIMKNKLSQVLVNEPEDEVSRVRVVYKVYNEQPWMRKMLGSNEESHSWTLALGFVDSSRKRSPDYVMMSFGVHY